MAILKLSSFIKESEEQALEEALGALSSLNAGNLLNVFKQQGWTTKNQSSVSADGNKFTGRGYAAGIGQNSSQENIGQISTWKDIRKKVKGKSDYVGVVLYTNGKAFASINFQGNDLSSVNDTYILAFDSSALPSEVVAAANKEEHDYSAPGGKKIVNQIVKKNTAKAEKKHEWRNDSELTGKMKTGVPVSTRELEGYVDDIISWLIPFGYNVTATLIGVDTEAQSIKRERTVAQSNDDELAKREREANGDSWSSGKKASLNTALDKFKASKNENTFSTEAELGAFITDSRNFGKEFVYQGKQYKYAIDSDYDNKITVKKDSLISGLPLEFSISCKATDKSGYNSLSIKLRYTGGKVEFVKVGY